MIIFMGLVDFFEIQLQRCLRLIKTKPEVKKWMRTPIKHYDKLFEIYGTDRATEKYAESVKERFYNGYSPEINLSNQSTGSQGTSSRVTKRKTTMSDKLESEMERMSQGIQTLTETMKDQVLTTEEQVQVAKEQVQIAKQQV
ncbi:hypothetical protein AHAS_Ahas19G0280100 [Arachis hypogaea]